MSDGGQLGTGAGTDSRGRATHTWPTHAGGPGRTQHPENTFTIDATSKEAKRLMEWWVQAAGLPA